MYIIVIGCGRLGCKLAQELSNWGHDICIIDRESSRLSALGSGFNGRRIHGIEFDNDNLLEAGVQEAQAVLAVSPDDNVNITVALIADKIYHVPEIIARVNDPSREDIYKKLKICTINPVQISVELLKGRLSVEQVTSLLTLDDSYEIIELPIKMRRSMSVVEVEKEFHCKISSIRRNGIILLAKDAEVLLDDDRIICTVKKSEEGLLINEISREAPIWVP